MSITPYPGSGGTFDEAALLAVTSALSTDMDVGGRKIVDCAGVSHGTATAIDAPTVDINRTGTGNTNIGNTTGGIALHGVTTIKGTQDATLQYVGGSTYFDSAAGSLTIRGQTGISMSSSGGAISVTANGSTASIDSAASSTSISAINHLILAPGPNARLIMVYNRNDGVIRFLWLFPAPVVPVDNSVTPLHAFNGVLYPLNSNKLALIKGTVHVRASYGNHKTFELNFIIDNNGTNGVATGGATLLPGNAGTVATVAGDITVTMSGKVPTINIANASGYDCALELQVDLAA